MTPKQSQEEERSRKADKEKKQQFNRKLHFNYLVSHLSTILGDYCSGIFFHAETRSSQGQFLRSWQTDGTKNLLR